MTYRPTKKEEKLERHRKHKANKKAKPDDERKEKRRLARFRAFFAALLTLPHVVNVTDHKWAEQIHGFVSEETGWLKTKDLPRDTLLSLRSKLNDFGMQDDIKQVILKMNLYPVVVDSGASAWSTQDLADMIPHTVERIKGMKMGGIAEGLTIEYRGIIRYEVMHSSSYPGSPSSHRENHGDRLTVVHASGLHRESTPGNGSVTVKIR